MDYYGTGPSSDFFEHYGVRGMKWGIRRAINKGSEKSLARQYRKAQKKLTRLENKTNRELQLKKANKYAKVAAASGGVALSGFGMNVGGKHLRKKGFRELDDAKRGIKKVQDSLGKNYAEALANPFISTEMAYNTFGKPYETALGYHVANKNRAQTKINNGTTLKKAGAVVGLGGLAVSGAAGLASLKSRYNASDKGHTKAVIKRDMFKEEMQSAFRGANKALKAKSRRKK